MRLCPLLVCLILLPACSAKTVTPADETGFDRPEGLASVLEVEAGRHVVTPPPGTPLPLGTAEPAGAAEHRLDR